MGQKMPDIEAIKFKTKEEAMEHMDMLDGNYFYGKNSENEWIAIPLSKAGITITKMEKINEDGTKTPIKLKK